jgi:hypothetical protein
MESRIAYCPSARTLSIALITLASVSYVWVKHSEQTAPAATAASRQNVLFDQDKEEQVPLTVRNEDEGDGRAREAIV